MASILKVNQIQHTNGTTSMTVGTNGVLSGPGAPDVVVISNDLSLIHI